VLPYGLCCTSAAYLLRICCIGFPPAPSDSSPLYLLLLTYHLHACMMHARASCCKPSRQKPHAGLGELLIPSTVCSLTGYMATLCLYSQSLVQDRTPLWHSFVRHCTLYRKVRCLPLALLLPSFHVVGIYLTTCSRVRWFLALSLASIIVNGAVPDRSRQPSL